eukprot:CAMPEP_0169088742 /NCGR_PEP_ID=MMETSP1015-20121227/14916_1 /TAXON_ID=342587 /ORGANISM="Karlodinium micrum, Strain CCMP2283" /LENGTH=174 /DNA_ID=CAMNT_0009149037 /DNA_START=185 /DNA_END=709 /DNA_ORIENTATION=+
MPNWRAESVGLHLPIHYKWIVFLDGAISRLIEDPPPTIAPMPVAEVVQMNHLALVGEEAQLQRAHYCVSQARSRRLVQHAASELLDIASSEERHISDLEISVNHRRCPRSIQLKSTKSGLDLFLFHELAQPLPHRASVVLVIKAKCTITIHSVIVSNNSKWILLRLGIQDRVGV